MNHAELKRIIDELGALEGDFLRGVWQVRRDRVVVGIGETALLMVPRGPEARIHLIRSRPPSPRRPFSFQGACRAHLAGALRTISLAPQDRVVALTFDQGSLHLRLTGSRGGLWLVVGSTVVGGYDGPAPATLPSLPEPPPAPPRARSPRFAPRDDETWNEAAEQWFAARERERLLVERRRELGRRLRLRIEHDRRLIEALHRDLAKADGADRARARADALASRLHEVRRGTTCIQTPDLLDPDIIHEIVIDPTRSPGQNLERLYATARRLDRMGERVLEHLDAVERRIRSLVAARAVVEDADNATLERLEALVPRRERQRRTTSTGEPWWVWRTPHGQEVLIGKNAGGNRRLTFQKARGTDWWMHLRGRPGAHIVIRCHRGQPPSLPTLLGAAELAGRYARIDEGQRYEVQVARIRDVRSIPGAADGRVLVNRERVMDVVRDPAQLVGWTREGTEDLDIDALTREIAGRSA